MEISFLIISSASLTNEAISLPSTSIDKTKYLFKSSLFIKEAP
jgi:hypothetical protein